VHVATPSYNGTHIDGFNAAVRAVVEQLAERGEGETHEGVNLFPGFVSATDLRYIKEVTEDFGLPLTLFPDYSETMDAPVLEKYSKIPAGGTPVAALRASGSARASIEFGRTLRKKVTAASFLNERFSIPAHRIGMPVGLRETDTFFEALESLSGKSTPAKHASERGRLIDSDAEGHNDVFSKRAIIFGDEDLVVGLAAFLSEIGIVPVMCASGGRSGALQEAIDEVCEDITEPIVIRDSLDFMTLGEEAKALKADFMIGSSKGARVARELDVPLVRVGFPIHDRIGGQRVLHLGYRGAQQLFDLIVNTLIEAKQESSAIGYSYM
jgi:nitrogenase molybdenum-iron protein NifN